MGASVKQGLSEILKYNLVSFVYSGGFLEVSPSMLSLLGYSEKQLKNLKLEDIIDNYENTFLFSVIEHDSYLTNSGSVYGEVRFMDAVGYLVEGTLKIEWQGKGDTKIFGYFYPHNGICAEDKTSAVKKISDLSGSLYFEIDKKAKTLVDMGSGGGFPAVVVAILNKVLKGSLTRIVLIESDNKKTVFLKEISRVLDLNLEILNSRIEEVANIKADVITSRALGSVSLLLDLGSVFYKKGTSFLLLKGESVDFELKNVSLLCKKEKITSKTNKNGCILKITEVEYL